MFLVVITLHNTSFTWHREDFGEALEFQCRSMQCTICMGQIFRKCRLIAVSPIPPAAMLSACMLSLSHTYITPTIYTIEVLCHCSQYFNCAYRNVIFNFTCVWQKLFLLAYFTIQFIFATIYRSHGTISANFYFYL